MALTAAIGMHAADGDLFPYPVPPADMERLDERCDYLVTHFWDRCDMKSAFSKTEKLNNTFGDWISFMPYASADSVYTAIGRLLESVKKSGPQTLGLARMAEQWTYSDTAEIFSEEIYYPFAKAVAENRKISGADRARFENQVQIIDNVRQGGVMGHLQYVTPEGLPGSLETVRTQAIVVFINDHDCEDCALARVRLSADINANALIKAGLLTIMCIEPDEATPEWLEATTSYPAEWIVGASEDASSYFPLRTSPEFYLLDARHRVLAKGFPIDGMLRALAAIRANTGI
ncbi:MAG: DUF5106 domain-containing protein [Bacteroidales bacterium]|nr:DUF5106 domain-containing protein [Bacteroidales bacterium]